MNISLYVISFNTPKQFQLLLDSIIKSNPELLNLTSKFLVNNSTETFQEYDDICAKNNFTQIKLQNNLGFSGARYFAAKHFSHSDSEYMLWFEDDMLLVDHLSICKNGLSRHVDNWLDKCVKIVDKENLDYLKLSFSEVFGDHHEQWAQSPREKLQWRYSNCVDGLSYIIGDVFYSNWPQIITKTGNNNLFLNNALTDFSEVNVKNHSFKLLKSNKIKSGVLMASLVNHCRTYSYKRNLRRDFLPINDPITKMKSILNSIKV